MFKQRQTIAIEDMINFDYDTSLGVEAVTITLQDVDLSSLQNENKDLKQINNNLSWLNKTFSKCLCMKDFCKAK